MQADREDVVDIKAMRQRYRVVRKTMNERTRRQWAGAEALAAGRGGIAAVQRVTGLCYRTVVRGIREAQSSTDLDPERIRAMGGGRKRAEDLDPDLAPALEALVELLARGDPQSPLRWSFKSTRRLSHELRARGHAAGRSLVCELLHAMGYSLGANRKTREGSSHVNRNRQFEYINAQATAFLKGKRLVVSVDTKKKELVGDFKNGGREWRPRALFHRSRRRSG